MLVVTEWKREPEKEQAPLVRHISLRGADRKSESTLVSYSILLSFQGDGTWFGGLVVPVYFDSGTP